MKTKRILLVILAAVAALSLALLGGCKKGGNNSSGSGSGSGSSNTGSGSSGEVELKSEIGSRAELLKFFETAPESGSFTLTADITLNSRDELEAVPLFTGVFDGGGHKIAGAVLPDGGLFKKLDGATVKNLALEAEISSPSPAAFVGAIAAEADGSVISNVDVIAEADLVSSQNFGGIVGKAADCSIYNSLAEVSLAGNAGSVGGLVSTLQGGQIFSSKSVVDGSVKAVRLGGAAAQKDSESALFSLVCDLSGFGGSVSGSSGGIVAAASYEAYVGEANVAACYYIGSYGGLGKAYEEGSPDAFGANDWKDGRPVIAPHQNGKVNITIDGKASAVDYLSKAPENFSEGEGVYVNGYLFAGELYPASVPFVADIALEQNKIDYSAYVGEWVSQQAGDEYAYGSEISKNGDSLGRAALKVQSGNIFAYYYDGGELCRIAYASDGGMLVVQKIVGGSFQSVENLMPVSPMMRGEVTIGGSSYILTKSVAKKGNTYGFSCVSGGVGDVYSTKLSDGEIAVVLAGGEHKLSALTPSDAALSGEWKGAHEVSVDTAAKSVTVDGAAHDYTVEANKNYGFGISFDGGFMYAAPGGAHIVMGGADELLLGETGGELVTAIDGKLISASFAEGGVIFDGHAYADDSLSVEGGVYSFEHEGTEVNITYVEGSTELAMTYGGKSAVLITREALARFTGSYSTGSVAFEIGDDGSVTRHYRGEDESFGYTVVRDSSRGLALTFGGMTEYISSGKLMLDGMFSYVRYDSLGTFELCDASVISAFLASVEGDYQNYFESPISIHGGVIMAGHGNAVGMGEIDYYYANGAVRIKPYFSYSGDRKETNYPIIKVGEGMISVDGEVYIDCRAASVMGVYAASNSSSDTVSFRFSSSYADVAPYLKINGVRYSVSDIALSFAADKVTVTAGGKSVDFVGNTALIDGKTLYSAYVLPSESVFYGASGSSVRLSVSETAPYARITYNGKVATSVEFGASGATATVDGESIAISYSDRYNATVGGKPYWSAEEIRSGVLNVNFTSGSDRIRLNEGVLYYNGREVEATFHADEDGGVTFSFDSHSVTFHSFNNYITFDGKNLPNPYFAELLGSRWIGPTGNTFETYDDGRIFFNGDEVFAHTLNDSNMRFFYFAGDSVHELTLDYGIFQIGDGAIEDNSRFVSEGYTKYGGLYRSDDGEYLSIERERAIVGASITFSYFYRPATNELELADGVAKLYEGYVELNGKRYNKVDFDEAAFYGTYYVEEGTSVTVNHASFEDGDVKSYIDFNGQTAVVIDFRYIIAVNVDEATKASYPKIAVSDYLADYFGEHSFNGGILKIGYEVKVQSRNAIAVAVAYFNDQRIDDFKFADTNLYASANFTLDGTKYTVSDNDYEGYPLMVWTPNTSVDPYLGIYSLNGMHYRFAYYNKSADAADAEIALLIYKDNDYDEFDVVFFDNGVRNREFTFSYKGENYFGRIGGNPTVTIMKAVMRDYVVSGKNIDGYTLKLSGADSGNRSVVTVSKDGASYNGILTASGEGVLFEEGGAIKLFDAKSGAIVNVEYADLSFVGSFDVPGTYGRIELFVDVEDGKITVDGRSNYSSLTVKDVVYDNGLIRFTAETSYDSVRYILYKEDVWKVVPEYMYNLIGSYQVSEHSVNISLSSAGTLAVTFDGASVSVIAMAEGENGIAFKSGDVNYVFAKEGKEGAVSLIVVSDPEFDLIGYHLPALDYSGYEDEADEIWVGFTVADGKVAYIAQYLDDLSEFKCVAEDAYSLTLLGSEYVMLYSAANKNKAQIVVPQGAYELIAASDDEIKVEAVLVYSSSNDSEGDAIISVSVSYSVTIEGKAQNATYSEGKLRVGGKTLSLSGGKLTLE